MSVIILSIILGLLILLVTRKDHIFLRFFGFASLIYFMVFVVSPMHYKILEIYEIPIIGRYAERSNASSFVYVQILAIVGYLSMLFGNYLAYLLAGKNIDTKEKQSERIFGNKFFIITGVFLLVTGLLSFLFYANDMGGIAYIYKYAGGLRSGAIPNESEFGFLKTVSTLVLASSFFLFAFSSQKNTFFSKILFLVSFLLSTAILLHLAGRLRVFAYVLTFFMARMITKNKVNFFAVITTIVISIPVILFGKHFFNLLNDENSVARKVDLLTSDPSSAISLIIIEFSFPILSLAYTLDYVVPFQVPYRWFIDFFLAFVYVIPKRIFPIVNMPETTNTLNVKFMGGPIPIDMLSLGYYSCGVFGIFILLLTFGFILGYLDSSNNFLQNQSLSVFKAALIIFIGFRIMYGDPFNSLKTGFYIIVSFLIIFLFKFLFVRKRETANKESIPSPCIK